MGEIIKNGLLEPVETEDFIKLIINFSYPKNCIIKPVGKAILINGTALIEEEINGSQVNTRVENNKAIQCKEREYRIEWEISSVDGKSRYWTKASVEDYNKIKLGI